MLDLLKNLIKARSTPDTGELAVAEVIAAQFQGLGIKCDIDTWDKSRANILVHAKSTGQKPALLFASHLDVVPTGSVRWKYPPFEAAEVDGKVFGRGASDMKGSIAAAITAISQIISSDVRLKGDLIFAATAGEETDSCGTKRFVDSANLPKLAGIIVTEPTDLAVIHAHRGILWLKFTTKGKTAHGSMPHLGINAIESARLLLNELAEYRLVFTPHLRLGHSSMSINTISGGKAANVIPDECSITVDIRTLPNQSHAEIAAGFERLLAKLKVRNPGFDAELAVVRDCPALETDPEDDFVKIVCDVRGTDKPGTVSYTTDGPFFAALRAPVIIFGPGKAEMCHQPNEYIETADVESAVKYYKETILKLLT
jgi:succinyl-diaminopimelate desuccinylase